MRLAACGVVCCFMVLNFGICFPGQRLVVAELTTNTSCGGCYYANNALDQIVNNFEDDELAVIRYHAWWPSAYDPFYQYNVSENSARIYYYGADYAPHIRIDGTVDGGSSYNTWQNLISNELNVSSPLEINLGGSYDPVGRTGNINLQIIATDSISHSNLRLRITLTEDSLYFVAPNGSRWHHQTFRDMVPSTSGIAFSISRGDTLYFSRTFSCPTALDYEQCKLVAFVQSDSGRRILQGAKISVKDLEYSLTPFDLISPYDDTTLSSCTPYFIWHESVDLDSGYAVEYRVNISLHANFSNPIISEALSDTFWQSPYCLQNDSTYYWRVIASNDHAPDRYSEQVYNFLIDEGEIIITPSAMSGLYLVADDTTQIEMTLYNNSYYDITYTLSDSGDIISFEYESGELDTFAMDSVNVYISTLGLVPGEYGDTVYVATTHPVSDFLKIPVDLFIYVHGDVNCDNNVIGSDVTYLVNYFRGVADPPCDPFLRADVNGDCQVIGSDVTYLVNYFRGVTPRPVPGDCD